MSSAYLIPCVPMDMKSPTNLTVDVNHNNNRLSVVRPRTPTSPNPLDNEVLMRRQSTGLSAFNDYVDLVKRHLMYAVREEVEILKQQIGEMMERIGQLEYENSILRSEAKPETLSKLQQPRLPQPTPQVVLPSQPQPQTASVLLTPAPQHPVVPQVQPPQQQPTAVSQVGQPPSTT